MKISDYLKPEYCIMDLKAKHKDESIRELAQCIQHSGKIIDAEKFVGDILEREQLGSTGIGNNIAIPHSRTDAVNEFVISFGYSKKGIEFKALDGNPVNFIFLMGANPNDLNLYLRLLAELSKLLMESSFRNELATAKQAKEVIEIFRKFET